MKSSAGFKCLKWLPSSNPSLFLLWSEALWRMSATRLCLGKVPLPSSTLPLNKSCDGSCLSQGASLASLGKPLLPNCIAPNAELHCLVGLAHCLQRKTFSPQSPKSFVPTIHLWRISEGYISRSALWCLYWPASFPFFNNQGSRKCGELTAWQQQRNSLGKLRWSLLRFQPLRQESQRSNHPLVVFNHFFCGTFLVRETNLSVQHGWAWDHNCRMVVLIQALPDINQVPLTWRMWRMGAAPSLNEM